MGQGMAMAAAIRQLGISEVTFYLYGRLSRCKRCGMSGWVSCKHLSGITRIGGAQMGSPRAPASKRRGAIYDASRAKPGSYRTSR